MLVMLNYLKQQEYPKNLIKTYPVNCNKQCLSSYYNIYKHKKIIIMGGFTKIVLRDCSQVNIDSQNNKLKKLKVAKQYRFYSEKDVQIEYEFFKKEDGYFPENQFPREKIKSYKDFTKYWSTEALGEVFVPKIGTLTFDCYFGRTSKRAMKVIASYLMCNLSQIKEVDGSYSTFVERCGWGKARQAELMELDK